MRKFPGSEEDLLFTILLKTEEIVFKENLRYYTILGLTNYSHTVSYKASKSEHGEHPVAQELVAAGDVGGGTAKDVDEAKL